MIRPIGNTIFAILTWIFFLPSFWVLLFMLSIPSSNHDAIFWSLCIFVILFIIVAMLMQIYGLYLLYKHNSYKYIFLYAPILMVAIQCVLSQSILVIMGFLRPFN